jgi:hypothetical protein
MKTYYLHSIIALLMIALWPVIAAAQMEIKQEKSSLYGLKGVGFAVNTEQNTPFPDSQLVKISDIKKHGKAIIRKSALQYYDDKKIRSSILFPVLYMHINSFMRRKGIISFAITINLIQPVKLVLNGGRRMMAATWQQGEVGLASYANKAVIQQAAMGLLKTFIDDYNKANNK